VSGAIGYGVLALTARWTMVPAAALIALGGLATPSVRAMVAGRGGVDYQGEMQGVPQPSKASRRCSPRCQPPDCQPPEARRFAAARVAAAA
jgi:hypothetical protein